MAVRNALPFEFPWRWNDIRRFFSNLPDEAADLLDQRDRNLEDFLASLDDDVTAIGNPPRPALLALSTTGDSIASGGDYITFDTTVYRYEFDGVGVDNQTVTWPATAVGEIQVEFAWDSYTGGGKIEIEVDGAVPAWGLLADGASGQSGCKRRSVHIAEGASVKIKVTQSSGAAQTCNAHVEFSIPDPSTTAVGSDYESAVVADGPLGYWKLDESSGATATDSSGNGHHMTYVNSPTLGAAGLMQDGSGATAADLNGTTQGAYLDSSVATAFDFDGFDPFTVEVWVNFDALGAHNMLAGKQQGSSGVGWEFQVLAAGDLVLNRTVTGPALKSVQTAAGAVTTGVTYHLVGTFDGTTGALYINGSLSTSADISGSALSSSGISLGVGVDISSSDWYVNGRMDEVAVYARALSATEVEEHYTIGTGG